MKTRMHTYFKSFKVGNYGTIKCFPDNLYSIFMAFVCLFLQYFGSLQKQFVSITIVKTTKFLLKYNYNIYYYLFLTIIQAVLGLRRS